MKGIARVFHVWVVSISMMLAAWLVAMPAQASRANQASPLGVNLPFFYRWVTDWPTIDEFKRADVLTTDGVTWDTNEATKVDWDENGWPRSLTPLNGQSATFTQIGYLLFDNGYPGWGVPSWEQGDYHVFHEGEGTLVYDLGASKVGSCGAGCDVVHMNGALARIRITATNPDNYLRNIQVIHPGGLCDGDPFTWYASANDCPGTFKSFDELRHQVIFHPVFLNDLKRYKVIRFLNYQQINEAMTHNPTASTTLEWSQRTPFSYAVWSDGIRPDTSAWLYTKKGVPVEAMVALLNVLGADGWFHMPYQASDDYVRQFADLVRQSLTRGQRIYLELGNEAWNFAPPFGISAEYLKAKGAQLWGTAGSEYDRQMSFYAKRSIEICNLWKQNWGDQADRITCVLGGQAAASGVTEAVVLECPLWKNDSRNPNQGQSCASQVDALAIAPYFGGYLGDPATQNQVASWSLTTLFDVLNGGAPPAATAGAPGSSVRPVYPVSQQWRLAGELNRRLAGQPVTIDSALIRTPALLSLTALSTAAGTPGNCPVGPARGGTLPEAKAQTEAYRCLADQYGVSLIGYEGGQHLVGYNGAENNAALNDLFIAANRDGRMQTAYARYLTDWKAAGGELMAMYEAVGQYTQYGSWGLREHQRQTDADAPKAAAVDQFLDTVACWWGGCDQQRYVKTLQSGIWYQLALPCQPDAGTTLADLLGDDLPAGSVYGTDWVVYAFDPTLSAHGNYQQIQPTDPLSQGIGYWVIHVTGSPVLVDMPASCQPTPVVASSACTSQNGCFEIPLGTRPNAVQWNMAGFPFADGVPWNRSRVRTASGACSTSSACTLTEAASAKILHDQAWHYEGDTVTPGYRLYEGGARPQAWDGFWSPTLKDSDGLQPALLMPVD